MFADSFLPKLPRVGKEYYTHTVILDPGFFAKPEYYLRPRTIFHNHRIRVVFPGNILRNVQPWDIAHQLVEAAIADVKKKYGHIPIPIGHSKGGTDLVTPMALHSEIPLGIFIASPMQGLSFNSLRYYMRLFHKSPSQPFHPDILEDKHVLSRLVVFICAADGVVYPEEARIAGVREEVIVPGDVKDPWNSHTGLPFLLIDDLIARIKEEKAD